MKAYEIVKLSIGKLLDKGHNQKEIARILGITPGMISQYKKGENHDYPTPNGDLLIRCIVAIGGDVDRSMPDWDPTEYANQQSREEIRRLQRRISELEGRMKAIMEALEPDVPRRPAEHEASSSTSSASPSRRKLPP